MLASGMKNVLSQSLGGQRARADSHAAWDRPSWINFVLEDEELQLEEVIIIMPVSQPPPQASDPVRSLSCTVVSSLWAALGLP